MEKTDQFFQVKFKISNILGKFAEILQKSQLKYPI